MGRNLHVDPVDIHISAGHVDVTADDLRSEHGIAYTTMAEAHCSWVGSSAAALTEKTSEWQSRTTRHYTKLVEYSNGLRSAAHAYTNTDTESGSRSSSVAERMGL
jgi:WXG100 family type VII secretion target